MIVIDFKSPQGKLRHSLHSSGYMPNVSIQNIFDFSDAFKELHFLEARTHDQACANPGQRVVDTHFVFPRIDADPADPANYYFAATDHLLENCRVCGTGILYRLGTSIEHTRDRHFNAIMPEDFEHYAEALAGIVRHYNEGWADGYRWDIKHWEVWNEPDLGDRMWSGTMEDYNRFYGIVAKRLKKEFPGIKIGGLALCGLTPQREQMVSDFLNHCRDQEAPVDFISWHCYTADVAKLVDQPIRARRILDSHGFKETETMLNEWHYLRTWDGLHNNVTPELFEQALNGPAGMFGIDSAAFNISVIAAWHDTPLDAAYYYGYGDKAWGFTTLYRALNKNYHSMFFIGQMMTRFPNRVEAKSKGDTVSILAGTDGEGNCGILVADYCGEAMEIPLEIKGVEAIGKPVVLLLDADSDREEISVDVTENQLVLRKRQSGSAVFFITFSEKGH